MTKTVTLLIDGDIVAFSAVSAAQMDIEWSPDCWSNYVDMKAAKDDIMEYGICHTDVAIGYSDRYYERYR